jgi:hypothetical protein
MVTKVELEEIVNTLPEGIRKLEPRKAIDIRVGDTSLVVRTVTTVTQGMDRIEVTYSDGSSVAMGPQDALMMIAREE